MRMNRRPHKVKVYGTNSTKDVRARCIDILRERVMYHKDKFIAPLLHSEMSAMEVKKNGKVEHSVNSHDDQVFSYLMALYVWYDGKDLAQNFGIIKNTLKTDDAEEMEELDFEDQLESNTSIDLRKLETDVSDEFNVQLNADLDWMEKDLKTIKSADQFEEEQRLELDMLRREAYTTNKALRDQAMNEFGVDAISNIMLTNFYTSLPDSIFATADEEINFDDWDNYGLGNLDQQSNLGKGPRLAGNLAGAFSRL